MTLPQKILELTRGVAQEMMDVFYHRHPEWHERFGTAGFLRGLEDSEFHLRFLASALELESPYAFGDYVAWVRMVLVSRGIRSEFLAETLEDMAGALEARLQPAEFAALKNYLAEGARICKQPVPAQADITPTPFLQAVLQGDRRAAATILLEQIRSGATLLQVYQDVVVGAVDLVGQLWQCNRISVADEHTATETISNVVAQLYAEVAVLPPNVRGKAILTGVQGERHQLGSRLVADLWELEGFVVRYLGTDLPIPTVMSVLEQERPRVLGVSVTLPANVGEAVRLIGSVRGRWSEREVAIVIGGRGFANVSPGFFDSHNVQARASDLHQAVSLARSF